MAFPNDPPVTPSEFDYRDRQHLAAMYYWAGSCNALSEYLGRCGVNVSPGTLNKWRKKLGIPIAQDSYRERGEEVNLSPEASDESVYALLDYLKNRTVPKGRKSRAKPRKGDYLVEVIASDIHYPHHHEAAFEVFLSLLETIQPDGLSLNGDTFDFAQLGRYVQNPENIRGVQTDIDGCREEVFARINAALPEDASRTVIMGNHEYNRWVNYLWTRCPEVASLRVLDLETLLGLDEMGWAYERDGYWLLPDTLVVDHGDRHSNNLGGGSAMSARKEMLDVGTSGITGHSHHAGIFYRRDNAGYRLWIEGGCLCDWRKMRDAGVTSRKRGPKTEDWHIGVTVVWYAPDGSSFDGRFLPIVEGQRETFAIWNGERIAA